jgi:hypothetical protein
MGQTHRDRTRVIGSHDGYMRGCRLADRKVVGRLSWRPLLFVFYRYVALAWAFTKTLRTVASIRHADAALQTLLLTLHIVLKRFQHRLVHFTTSDQGASTGRRVLSVFNPKCPS